MAELAPRVAIFNSRSDFIGALREALEADGFATVAASTPRTWHLRPWSAPGPMC